MRVRKGRILLSDEIARCHALGIHAAVKRVVPLALRRIQSALASLLLASSPSAVLSAQDTVIRVRDDQGVSVPFAVVRIQNGAPRIADDSGVVTFRSIPGDSVGLLVRRIGYEPFSGRVVRRAPQDTIVVTLRSVAGRLAATVVEGRPDSPLTRTGFYDRLLRTQNGAYSARFFTPEDLEARNPTRLTQVLQGESMVRVTRNRDGQLLLLGRSPGCAMTVLLDGQRVRGTLEEAIENPRASRSGLLPVDDLVPAHSIAAIEVYGSAANAPVELLRAGGSRGCGIVAIWTGSRR